MEKNKNLHADHRKRMREKYRTSRDNMPEHEILEVLLFSVIPRKNTNPIAHDLINRFGSLEKVLFADVSALLEVEGVGKETAFFLNEIRYLFHRLDKEKSDEAVLDSYEKLVRHFTAYFSDDGKEAVYGILLDSKNRLIVCEKLFEGSVSTSAIDARRVAEFALLYHATRVVLAHNHLSGSALPSDEDISATRYLRRVLNVIDVTLEEHFVISGREYCPILEYIDNVIGHSM